MLDSILKKFTDDAVNVSFNLAVEPDLFNVTAERNFYLSQQPDVLNE
jgi:hypothetical protein